MPKKTKPPEAIYQLKITLRESRPLIWRRVLVPAEFNLFKLHYVIQIAMGWTDSHLHQFIIDGQCHSLPHPDDLDPVIDERRSLLKQVAVREKRKFVYEYDFGDSWEHEIVVEKILAPDAGEKYPVCVKGKRACPPEDVGGVWGYADFLAAVNDPKHPQHEEYANWLGIEFDPEALDLEKINRELRRIK